MLGELTRPHREKQVWFFGKGVEQDQCGGRSGPRWDLSRMPATTRAWGQREMRVRSGKRLIQRVSNVFFDLIECPERSCHCAGLVYCDPNPPFPAFP